MSSASLPRSSGGSSSRRPRGPGSANAGVGPSSVGTGTATDARRALITSRHQASAQIRKRRKEEILLEKRRGFGFGGGLLAASGATDAASASTSAASATLPRFGSAAQTPYSAPARVVGDDQAFQHSLEQFLQNPPSSDWLEALVAQWDDRAASLLQGWVIVDSGSREQRFLEHLRGMVVTPLASGSEDVERGRMLALKLVEALVSTASPAPQHADEDLAYYSGGAATPQRSLGWSCAIARRGELWFPTLASLLPLYPGAAGSILSHLYQDSALVLVAVASGEIVTARSLLIPQFWPNIVAALSLPSSYHGGGSGVVHPPEVARLASVILQNDATTPGMQFLIQGNNNTYGGGLTSLTMGQLLHEPSTAVSAAWMLEGLTRREDAAVELLCRDATLVRAIVDALQFHANTSSAPMDVERETSVLVLLPTLRTIGNIVTACDGRLLVLFEPVFADALSVILANVSKLADEVLWVMGCCLVDSGKPHHVATLKLAPLWVPRIVAVLTEETSTAAVRFEVKRQALASLWIALSMPPDVDTFQERSAIQVNLDAILLQHVWNGRARGATSLLDSLVQMMGVSDVDTVICALRVLQRLEVVVSSERDHLGSRHVLDRLEEVHDLHGASPAGDLASILLELLQDDDEDEMEGTTGASSLSPHITNGSFTFGLPTTIAQDRAFPLSSATTNTPTTVGRGRGRPVPSWMEQRNL